MGEYGQPSSPIDLHDKPQEENAPKKPHAEEAEEGNLPVHDEEEIRDTEQEQSVPKAPEEIPEEAPGTSHGPNRSRQPAVPSNETLEIIEHNSPAPPAD